LYFSYPHNPVRIGLPELGQSEFDLPVRRASPRAS
jgi:hypothetical protein